MRHIFCSAALLLLLLTAPSARGADTPGVLTGSVDMGLRTFSSRDSSAKFQEYRDMSGGLIAGFDAGYRKGRGYFSMEAANVGQEDQFLSITGGNYGRFKVEFEYNQIPHRFALDAPSIWGGFGSSRLTLPDALQSQGQSAPSSPTSAREAAVQSVMDQYLDNADLEDWELKRKRVQAAVEVQQGEPLTFRLELSREDRDGAKPFFGGIGSGGTVQAYEIPEPVNYQTDSARLSAEYAKASQFLKIAWYSQWFDNDNSFLQFDNPLSLVDNPASSPYPINGARIPGAGRMGLPPGNRFHNITATGSLGNLPWAGRLTATVSSGRMRQDEPLLPVTVNSAFGAIDQPASSADARVDTTLYNIAFTADPADRLDLRAAWNSYEYRNKTASRVWNSVVMDTAGPSESVNVPTSYRNRRAEFELGYEVSDRVDAGLGYSAHSVRRTNREVADQDDKVWSAHVDSRPADWLSLRGSWEHSKRTGAYDYAVPFEAAGIDPDNWEALRKYDQASRKQDAYRLLASATPNDNLAITATVGCSSNDYYESIGGLLKDKSWMVSLDTDYAFTRGGSVYAFATYERFTDFQNAWQWNPGDDFSVREPGRWTADSRMRVTTVGFGFDYPVRPRKLDLLLDLTHSVSNGGIALFSPLGTSANDRNAYTPLPFESVEDSKLMRLDARLRYAFDHRLTGSLGWAYERFDYGDYQAEGFTNSPVQTSNGTWRTILAAGTLWKPYSVNMVYGRLSFKF